MTELELSEAEEYTESLAQIFAGSWRQIALAERIGVPKAFGLTTREWVEERLGGYVKLSIPDRREAVAELEEEGMSTREIGNVLGVDHATAARDSVANATPEEAAEPDSVANATPHVARATGENEWYTPIEYIEAARLVLGEIDLDPASCAEANELIKAKQFYSIGDDGLAHGWEGRVWLNPPYSSDLIGRFTSKLATHFHGGSVSAALVLVNNATETEWFQVLSRRSRAVAFPARRVKFWGPSGQSGAPLQGQAVLYLGADVDLFEAAFSAFGIVLHAR